MKLTKEVIAALKYHGYTTHTCDPDVFMSRYKTVEEMGDGGFIGDRGALEFLRKVFNEDGVSVCGPINTIEDITSEDITPHDINEETVVNPGIIDDSPTPEDVKELVENLDNVTVVNMDEVIDSPEETMLETEPQPEPPMTFEHEPEVIHEPVVEMPVVEEVVENSKPKKTTAKKTTKKES